MAAPVGYAPFRMVGGVGSGVIRVTAICPDDSTKRCRRTWTFRADFPPKDLYEGVILRMREAKWAAYYKGTVLLIRCPRHKGERRPRTYAQDEAAAG